MKQVCACSVNTFDLFVRNITGIALHQHRPAPHTLRTSRLTFGPNPSITRTFGASTVGSSDNGLIPLNHSNAQPSSVQSSFVQSDKIVSSSVRANSARAEEEVEDLSKDYLHDDWHAEAELVETWQQKLTDSLGDRVGVGEQERASQISDPDAAFTDNAAVHDLHDPSTTHEATLKAPLIPTNPNPTAPISAASSASSTPAASRAESRQQRKLRRIEGGTYNRARARPPPREQAMEAHAKSILNFMKASRGISEAEEEGEADGQMTGASLKARVESTPEKKPTSKTKIPTRANAEGTSRKIIAKPKMLVSATGPTQNSMSELPKDQTKGEREPWQVQKDALRGKFGEHGWQPRKRLSPDTVEGIRALHASDPSSYTTPVLSEHFKVTPEAIRRILRSKWHPNEEEAEDRRKRWEKRGERKWEAMAAQGVRPPAKWRAKGIKTPQAERKKHARLVGDAHVRWDDRSLASLGPSLASRIA